VLRGRYAFVVHSEITWSDLSRLWCMDFGIVVWRGSSGGRTDVVMGTW
jgi:hypothetical protein